MTVRILTPNDAEALRDLRLLALHTTPEFFTADTARETRRTLRQWAAVARETSRHAIFGGFGDGKLDCMCGAKRFSGDHEGKTAYWHSDFRNPENRNATAFWQMQRLRTEWCLSRGMTEAVFTIHTCNETALSVYVRNGTEIFKSEPRRFADGKIATAYWCRRKLSQAPTLIAAA